MQQLCNRIGIIENGRLLMERPAEDWKNADEYSLERLYFEATRS